MCANLEQKGLKEYERNDFKFFLVNTIFSLMIYLILFVPSEDFFL